MLSSRVSMWTCYIIKLITTSNHFHGDVRSKIVR